MRIIIIDSGKENHIKRTVSDCVSMYGEVSNVRISSSKPLHEVFFELKLSGADLFLSFDDAALLFKSELGGCSLNRIPAKMIHFVSEEKALNAFEADVCFNLSHFVMVPRDCFEKFSEEHEMIPNISPYDESDIRESLENTLRELWCL